MTVTITPINYTAGSGYIAPIAWRVVVGLGELSLDYDTGIIPFGPVTIATVKSGRYVDIWTYTTGNVMMEHNNWAVQDGYDYQYNEEVGSTSQPTLTKLGANGSGIPVWAWFAGAGILIAGALLFWKRKK